MMHAQAFHAKETCRDLEQRNSSAVRIMHTFRGTKAPPQKVNIGSNLFVTQHATYILASDVLRACLATGICQQPKKELLLSNPVVAPPRLRSTTTTFVLAGHIGQSKGEKSFMPMHLPFNPHTKAPMSSLSVAVNPAHAPPLRAFLLSCRADACPARPDTAAPHTQPELVTDTTHINQHPRGSVLSRKSGHRQMALGWPGCLAINP